MATTISPIVSAIGFPITQADNMGPHDSSIRYVMQIPSGTANASEHAWLGPIEAGVGSRIYIHVSQNNASGADNIRLTVMGAFDNPTVAPSSRGWFPMRGDIPCGLNQPVQEVTVGGHISIITPARSYLLRISSVTAVSSAVNVYVLVVPSG